MPSLVWLVTGTSSGFGAAISKAALARGDRVIATARNPSNIEQLKELGAATFALDVTAGESTIQQIMAEAVAVHGQIDVLVNNAGFILEGGVEEVSAEEELRAFNTNVFGQMAVARAVLPYMRARKSGVVANMGSTASWTGGANLGYYCATKMALAGLSIALREEEAHLGIEVTLIDPGYFRTDILTGGARVTAAKAVEDLAPALDPVKKGLQMYSHNQPGDPVKGAAVIVELLSKSGRAAGRKLPSRFALGPDAHEFVCKVMDGFKKEIEEWEPMGIETNI